MSRIALTPNASGTGTFTIAAPGTNTDRTLTLPDAATTLVGTDATQTLTNKSIAASQLTGALPAISGAALTNLSAGNLTGDVAAARITSALNATGSAPIYACRAWVNFDGTGTVTIRGSGNVSSITDNGIGNYTVNFATAMPDANYAVTGSVNTITGNLGVFTSVINSTDFNKTTTSVRVNSCNQAGNLFDANSINVAIFR